MEPCIQVASLLSTCRQRSDVFYCFRQEIEVGDLMRVRSLVSIQIGELSAQPFENGERFFVAECANVTPLL